MAKGGRLAVSLFCSTLSLSRQSRSRSRFRSRVSFKRSYPLSSTVFPPLPCTSVPVSRG